jgi:hypothetical protein
MGSFLNLGVGTGRGGFPPFLALPRNPVGCVISTREPLILKENRALWVCAGQEVQVCGTGWVLLKRPFKTLNIRFSFIFSHFLYNQT